MAENFFIELALSMLDFLRGAFIYSIPVFLFTMVAVVARRLAAKRFKMSWITSTMLVTFFMTLSLVTALYLSPIIQAFQEPSYTLPPELESPLSEKAYSVALQAIRLVAVSVVLSLLLLPLELAGSFVFEWLSKKTGWTFIVRLYAAVFVATLLAAYFAFFVFPFAISGIVYMIFYGFA